MSTPSAFARPAVRAVLSVLILVHLFAVFVGPWALPPSSDLAGTCFRFLQPYVQAMFLDNGYRFFAPEPGPSHLVRYEIVRADGSQAEGFFPNRNEEWPRLLYHRHFMLSEFLNTTMYMSQARRTPELLKACARSYARHLARRYNAKEVTLFLRQHEIPTIYQVRQGIDLTDPSLYEVNEERRFGPYQGDEL